MKNEILRILNTINFTDEIAERSPSVKVADLLLHEKGINLFVIAKKKE